MDASGFSPDATQAPETHSSSFAQSLLSLQEPLDPQALSVPDRITVTTAIQPNHPVFMRR